MVGGLGDGGGEVLERRFLGVVEVDSGTLVLGDPLHFLADESLGRAGVDYAAVLEAADQMAGRLAGTPALLIGRFGGDGAFPVFADVDEDGVAVSVTIEFIDPVEDEE